MLPDPTVKGDLFNLTRSRILLYVFKSLKDERRADRSAVVLLNSRASILVPRGKDG